MSAPILRNWFLPDPKSTIRREILNAEIQSFLGPDATTRPGKDVVDGKEVKGYWIKAYRNLTTEMIEDLQKKSRRWDQESQRSGRRVDYQDSRTYRDDRDAASRRRARRDDSPHMDTSFDEPRSRIAMAPPEPEFMDTRPDPQVDLYRTHTGQVAAPMSSAYGDQPGYAPQSTRGPQIPPGFVLQGNYLVPINPLAEFDQTGYGMGPSQGRSSQHYSSGPSTQYGQAISLDDPRVIAYQEEQLRYQGREDPRDSRYPPARVEPRHQSGRDVARYPSGREDYEPRYPTGRDDPRYASAMEDARFPPAREELRYPSSREELRHAAIREDPRYQLAREDPRYQQAIREDPRFQPLGREDSRHQPAGREDSRHQPAGREDSRYQPTGREDSRHAEPRLVPGSGYPERYAYPSPATSIGSGPAHDQLQSALQPSSYAQNGQYDQYGRPSAYTQAQAQAAPSAAQLLEQSFQPPAPRAETQSQPQYTSNGRERPSAPSGGSEPRRRRIG